MKRKTETSKDKSDQTTKPLTFRVSLDLYKRLEEYGSTQVDEAGLKLNAATAARRLMLIALKEFEEKSGKK